MTTKSTNPTELFFNKFGVKGTRRGSSDGGAYNIKTRRLVLPKSWAGKKVGVAVKDGLLIIAEVAGGRAVHKDQHFLTLPRGVIEADANLSLAKADAPADAPAGSVCYELPKSEK